MALAVAAAALVLLPAAANSTNSEDIVAESRGRSASLILFTDTPVLGAPRSDIRLIGAKGGRSRLVSPRRGVIAPDEGTFMRRGRQVAFMGVRAGDGCTDIFRIGTFKRGRGLVNLTRTPDRCEADPDAVGNLVTFRMAGIVEKIGVARGDRKGGVRIVYNPSDHYPYVGFNLVMEPSLSPDGDRIAFAVDLDESDSGIFSVSPDGTGLVQLTDVSQIPGTMDRCPRYTPDGKSIVFAREDENGDFRPMIMNADGSNVRPFGPLTGCGGALDPSGTRVAYERYANKKGRLVTRNLAGGRVRTVIRGRGSKNPTDWERVRLP